MRRLTERLRGLLGSLPEGPLKHSYPDWIHDTWRRDLGEEASLALMRAQNEPPETVVRLVRGDPPGEPTDVPGAYRVDRVDEQALAEGRVWPQSRGSQLAGLVVGAREGERILDSCAAPGGKATMLAGEVDGGRAEPGPRARAARQRRAARRDERARRRGRRHRAAARAEGLRPRARRRALLGPRRARRAPRPALARPPAARPPARAPAGGRRRGRSPAARSSTRSARSTRTRTRPSSRPPGSRSSRSARSGRSSPIRSGPSSC